MWIGIAMVVTALIVATAAIIIVFQYNKTQWDIANLQKDAEVQSSNNIKDGLDKLGGGICKTSTRTFLNCL